MKCLYIDVDKRKHKGRHYSLLLFSKKGIKIYSRGRWKCMPINATLKHAFDHKPKSGSSENLKRMEEVSRPMIYCLLEEKRNKAICQATIFLSRRRRNS